MNKPLSHKLKNVSEIVADRKIKLWLSSVLFTIGLLWTLPIPFGGLPDEPTYLEYGLFQTQIITDDSVNESNYKNITSSSCFAFKIDTPANCQKFELGSEVIHLSSTALINYPKPWFYLTSWPALFLTGEIALIATKVVAFLLSFSMLLIPIYYWKNGTGKLLISIAFGVTPLALSMMGAYNPNNIEIFSSIGIALMLFGKKMNVRTDKASWSYWSWLSLMVFLASTAKPLSGVITFGIFVLYGLFLFRVGKVNSKSGEQIYAKRDLIRFTTVGSLSLPISVLFSWPSISQAETIPVGQAEVNNLYTLLSFLIRSHDYFLEHAGLFGWRDLVPAPWMILLWLTVVCLIVFKVTEKISQTDKFVLTGLWVVTIFLAPALQSILLAHQYNVGLQTRYLSGIFGAVAIYTVAMTGERKPGFAVNIIKLWTLIAIVNGVWLFIRHSFGITPALTLGPYLIVDQIRNKVNWIPETWPVIILLILVLGYLLTISSKKITKT
jgi:hypothetical protein